MSKKLWGGRFAKKTDPLVEEFTRSIRYDQRIAEYDILGSKAHVHILKKAGYLTAPEASKLTAALDSLYRSVKGGTFTADPASEDIHTDIQNKLEGKVGELALKVHTARSRNDQVAYATKMYCKAELSKVAGGLDLLVKAFGTAAERYRGMVIPGYTHMQHAQPVYLKDYLGAYAGMLKRDKARLAHISDNIAVTLGSGALAGTPIDASVYMTAAEAVSAPVNPMDSVSDRDFVIETIGALCLIATHLSRLSEDLIIWSTKEFDFVEIDDSYCTGSSLMPQKKNPDVLELIRGYSGRLYGNLVAVLTMMKALPLTYNRDMQLDKEPLFNSFEIVSKELEVLTGLMRTLKFNEKRIDECLKSESLYATDLVYYLVDKGIPFTPAHSIVGRLIKDSLDRGILIKNMPEGELKKFSDRFVKKEVLKLFDPLVSVKSKRSVKR